MTKWGDRPHWEIRRGLPRQRRARRLARLPDRHPHVAPGRRRTSRPSTRSAWCPPPAPRRRARLAGDVPRARRHGVDLRRHDHAAGWDGRIAARGRPRPRRGARLRPDGVRRRRGRVRRAPGRLRLSRRRSSSSPRPPATWSMAAVTPGGAAVRRRARPRGWSCSAGSSPDWRRCRPRSCATVGGCGSTSTPRRRRRSASSGSSRSSTGAPATCATTPRTCSPGPRARLPDPQPLHKELLRNTVEVVTGICRTAAEAMADLRRHPARSSPGRRRARRRPVLGAGTHPFAQWSGQQLTEGHRYEELIKRTQWWGRQMLIWGVHVHVGVPAPRRR